MQQQPPYANWAPPQKSSSVTKTALIIGGVLALIFLAMPYFPDVIRVQLPQFEFVKKGATPEPEKVDPSLQLATSAPIVPQIVPPTPAVDSMALALAALRDSLAQAARAKAAKPKPAKRRAPPPEELEPDGWTEGDGELVPEQTSTVVPVTIQRSVTYASVRPASDSSNVPVPGNPNPSGAAPEPVAPAEGEAPWPLLCGEVISYTGQPVEGATVQLASPSLTVRTDKRGRFCLSCPPGTRVLRVEHAAFEPVSRSVPLAGQTVETKIWLTTPR
jgi:hypothetical protein